MYGIEGCLGVLSLMAALCMLAMFGIFLLLYPFILQEASLFEAAIATLFVFAGFSFIAYLILSAIRDWRFSRQLRRYRNGPSRSLVSRNICTRSMVLDPQYPRILSQELNDSTH